MYMASNNIKIMSQSLHKPYLSSCSSLLSPLHLYALTNPAAVRHYSPIFCCVAHGSPRAPPFHMHIITLHEGIYLQECCPEVSQPSSATSTLPFRTCDKHSLTSQEKKKDLAAQRKSVAHTCCECPDPKLHDRRGRKPSRSLPLALTGTQRSIALR